MVIDADGLNALVGHLNILRANGQYGQTDNDINSASGRNGKAFGN